MPDAASATSCFKAYDIRGRVPEDLDTESAYRIGRAFADVVKPEKVVTGYDIRLTSPELTDALERGLLDAGVDVYSLGLCGTEEIYRATAQLGMDGGVMVTASHNPEAYNGMKLVARQAKPIGRENGLADIEKRVLGGTTPSQANVPPGKKRPLDNRPAYIEHLLSYVDVDSLKPLKIVTDAGNGGAGMIVDALAPLLPFDFIKLNNDPDGHFPKGVPNPLLPENRDEIISKIKETGADLGIAWDGDFDRCFLFDEHGTFIEGYYIVGLLAEAFLRKQPGSRIIHDPRLTWNTIDVVTQAGGAPIQSKTGHAFIKDAMRDTDAIYGGEMSGHHYFRDFSYCDSGMIPWLLVVEMISTTGKSLSQLIQERMAAYPCSGEINFRVPSTEASIANILTRYENDAIERDDTDGISLDFGDWRFNLRASNTEPVLRLNVESRGDPELMKSKTAELSALISH